MENELLYYHFRKSNDMKRLAFKKVLFFLLFSIAVEQTIRALDNVRIDELNYNLGDVNAEVTKYFEGEEYSGDIVIPEKVIFEGRSFEVTSIENRAFLRCKDLKSVVIAASVDSIGFGAFYGCSNLNKILIKNKNIRIERDVFYGCESLPVYDYLRYADFIVIGPFDRHLNSEMRLRGTTVQSSDDLSSFKIKNGTRIIAPDAFSGCKNIESISIPNSVKVIGPDAFSNCSKLNSIKLPNSLKVIGSRAFRFCSSLVSIRIPASTISIGNYDCYNRMLNDYDISIIASDPILSKDSINPNEFITAHETFEDPFSRCSALEKIEVADGNKVYDSRDNCNALIETASNTILQGCKSTIIPETVKSIGYSAFEGCSGLFSMSFPESVTTINDYAFRFCTNLKKIDLPSSIKSIGRAAFLGCDLNEIYIPKSVMQIGYDSFLNRNDKFFISVAEGNQRYDSRNNCNAIIETSINTLIFGCPTTVIPSSVTSIGASAFSYCTALSTIEIPLSVTAIRESAFYGCSGLISINIPSSVKTIESNAFGNCSNLTSVRLSESIKTIGDAAFAGCSNIESISLPDSLSEIQAALFRGCVNMAEITIPGSVKSIGSAVFDGCAKLKSIILPDGLEMLGRSVFEGCSGLEKLYIPENVKTIGSGAFSGCTNLTEISLPGSLSELSNDIFRNCTYLQSVTLPNSIRTIGTRAFSGCKSIKQIKIPASVVSIYQDAFDECVDLKELSCFSLIPPQILNSININYFSSELSSKLFSNLILNYCTLYVSESSLNLYKETIGWNQFKTIKPIADR